MKKKDKIRFDKLKQIGCIACAKYGKESEPVIHHIRNHTGLGLRPSHYNIIPLCPVHHRTGKISVHLGKQAFEDRYGKQEDLAKKVRERIEEWDIITSIF